MGERNFWTSRNAAFIASAAYQVQLDNLSLPPAYRLGVKNTTIEDALERWSRSTVAIKSLFPDQGEFEKVDAARSTIQAGPRNVILLSWENPFARSGGLIAVVRELGKELAKDPDCHVLRIAPLHRSIKGVSGSRGFLGRYPGEDFFEIVSEFKVPFGDQVYPAKLLRCRPAGDNTLLRERWALNEDLANWAFLSSDTFFNADGGKVGSDPYLYSEQENRTEREGASSKLLVDSLFACAAVPYALNASKLKSNLILHAQDWQFASVGLTAKEAIIGRSLPNGKKGPPLLENVAVTLTCHNPFDHFLPKEKLALITQRSGPEYWPDIRYRRSLDGTVQTRGRTERESERVTVLSRMLPLLDAPVCAVSRVFASELTVDPMQTGHFVPHLQDTFETIGVVGIENGLFISSDQPFTDWAIRDAEAGDFTRILDEKIRRRHGMLEVLSRVQSISGEHLFGGLNAGHSKPLANLNDRVPIFLMTGRMDPAQKGADLLARAVDAMQPGMAKFIFIQMGASLTDPVVREYVQDLQNLARRHEGDVLVFTAPVEIYHDLLKGSTYTVWPSLYEPFGSVSESYIFGTPVVVRATGGLAQQVVDYRANEENCTGLAFRESVTNVQNIHNACAEIQTSGPSGRQRNMLYGAMVSALVADLSESATIYRNNPDTYGLMLQHVYEKARTLDWKATADRYKMLYEIAQRPK